MLKEGICNTQINDVGSDVLVVSIILYPLHDFGEWRVSHQGDGSTRGLVIQGHLHTHQFWFVVGKWMIDWAVPQLWSWQGLLFIGWLIPCFEVFKDGLDGVH